MGSLYEDYLAEAPRLLEFFACPPRAVTQSPPARVSWDGTLVEALRDYQDAVGGTASFQGNEAVVVTGQQPGLFTGPLYTIYKAATAVLLASRIEKETGTSCVPIFWVASEDHDFEEVRTAHFLTKDHVPLSLQYTPAQPVEGLPMHRVPLEGWIHEAIDDAAKATPGGGNAAEVAEFLHASAEAAGSLSDWMARLMARLFRNTGLVFFSPHLPAARTAAAPVLEREIRNPLASARLAREAGARLEAIGYAQQVAKGEHECNFLLETGGKRRKVIFKDGQYRLPEEQSSFPVEKVLGILQETPERFSPNVLLRPIVQQHLFPTAAYVAGPGEIAYWAQLKPLFEHFDKAMPAVYPRARCSLTDGKLNALRERFGFGLNNFARPVADLTEEAMRAAAESPAFAALQARRPPIEDSLRELAEALHEEDSVAGEMAEALSVKTGQYLDKIGRGIVWRDGQRAAAVERQVARLCYAFAPWRKPQERVYTVFSFVFQHGWDLIPRLLEELDIDGFKMNEVEL